MLSADNHDDEFECAKVMYTILLVFVPDTVYMYKTAVVSAKSCTPHTYGWISCHTIRYDITIF